MLASKGAINSHASPAILSLTECEVTCVLESKILQHIIDMQKQHGHEVQRDHSMAVDM